MTKRVIASTAAAVAVTAALASAAVDSGGPTAGAGPAERSAASSTNTTVITPMTASERDALKETLRSRLPLDNPQRYFAALRRRAVEGDAVSGGVHIGSPVGDVIEGGARLLRDDQLGAIRVVPTDRELCVLTTYAHGRSRGATDTCVPTAAAVAQGAWTVTQCSSVALPDRRFIAGAVPDGVDAVRALAGGTVVSTTTVTGNAFSLEVDDPIDALEFVGARDMRPVVLPPVAC